MLIYRKEDLSVFYFLQDVVFSGIDLVNVVDSFPDEVVSLPTVSVDAGKLKEELYEIGSRDKVRVRIWYIDIFAKNKSQRDDMGYTILHESKNGINIYNYDEGFPPSISPSRIAHMDILEASYEPIPVMLEEHENLYYRGQVILVTQNDTV